MRYKLDGIEIRSENAAKPPSQASRHLIDWIASRPHVRAAVDFGCGKLRYATAVSRICDRLVLVDSQIQLDRSLLLSGRHTTVRKHALRIWPSARVLTPDQFAVDRAKYGFVLCANVLSAIPSAAVRTQVFTSIRSHLAAKGQALFTTQYRNSYFKRVAASPKAERYDLGWLLRSRRGTFYYGTIPPEMLCGMLRAEGYAIHHSWAHEGSAYVLCGNAVG